MEGRRGSRSPRRREPTPDEDHWVLGLWTARIRAYDHALAAGLTHHQRLRATTVAAGGFQAWYRGGRVEFPTGPIPQPAGNATAN
eukprot:4034131-Amphidinium_carterae.1